jgi:adenylate kinase
VILVFLGPPGVGKGTQAKLLCGARSLRHVSTGDLLREAVASGSELGQKAKEFMDRGDLVPDEVMLGLVREVLDESGEGILFDGFPRTTRQADGLAEQAAERGRAIDAVVRIVADEDEIVRRMLARGRADDTEETVRHRLHVYQQNTAPLVEYYGKRGLLREVDGMGAIEDIHARIKAAVGADGAKAWPS